MSKIQSKLTPEDQDSFHSEGYIILPEFLDTEFTKQLKKNVDELMADRKNSQNREKYLVEYQSLGLLTSHPPLMNMLNQIMGPEFAMHHIHAVRQDKGNDGVHWHQDYEQVPQTNR